MNKLLTLIFFVVLTGIASAGTVTLSGTCHTLVMPNSPINFTLSNSGNDSAYSLVVSPFIQNAKLANSTYGISTLAPGTAARLEMNVTKIDEKGSTSAYFVVAYEQGGSIFTAVFPCVLDLVNTTSSQILLSPNVTVFSNGTAKVNVKVFNGGSGNINANISLIVPPEFSYRSSASVPVSLAPFQNSTITFSLGIPTGSQAEYSVAAVSSYSLSNLSYASMSSFTVHEPIPATSSFSSLFFIAAVVVIVLVLILILLSLRNRRKEAKNKRN